MPGSYQLLLGGQPADPDLTTLLLALDVEESMDLPAALQLSVPVSRSADGDLTYVNDPRFAPLANLAVVASPAADSPAAQCIFDGYVLSQKLHLETGTTNAQLTVWAQDASWLMNATEKAREWIDLSDADVAAAIFAEYGITPSDDNGDEESPAHTEDGHSLMQRGSDIQFLRMLARRNGRLCRIACTDTPGQRTGYFAKPSLGGEPAATLSLNDPVHWTVSALDLDWDVGRPTAVVARQALFSDPDPAGAAADTSDAGLALLGDRALADFAGQPMTVLLAAPVDGADELALRAQSVLREAQWFVRCEGEADLERLGTVLRAGMLVALDGIGAVHSGKYLVWNVRHRITQEAHTMKFTLVRNAVGMPPSGGAGGLAGLLGAL
ncbi:MAG TPA: contractile injection system protein, VgrG/Pvc8 family [Stellaceae bacterium]|nr:contractile injection system protein, VgrG/Pvc8 family [Stellaceae bacterium]